MLRELFLTALNLSLLGLPLMAVVLLLRALFKGGAPRRAIYAAWLLVFLRLAVPTSVASPFSFYNLLPPERLVEQGGTVAAVVVSDSNATVDFPVLMRGWEDNPRVDGGGVAPAKAPIQAGETIPPSPPRIERRPVDLLVILAAVWGCGAAMLCTFGLFGYLLVLWKVRRESFRIELPEAAGASRARIYRSELFHTPVVCGAFFPKVILPMELDTDDHDTLRTVLAHEQTHIRRMDNLWRLLASLTLYLHWFNPLAWVCYCAFIRDMEVSCDERVLAKSPSDIRAQYAKALLTLASSQVNPLYGGMLSFGESGIKERVKHIMSFQRAKLFAVILCAAVVVGLGMVFLTNPTRSGDPEVETFAPASSDALAVSESSALPVSEGEPMPLPSAESAAPEPESVLTSSLLLPTPEAPQAASKPAGKEVEQTGYDIKYEGGEVTYVYVLDLENASYRLVEDRVDRVNLVLAAVGRKSTTGSGQILIHTTEGKYALGYDPAVDAPLAKLSKEVCADTPNVAQWLAWMTDKNLVRAQFGGDPRAVTVTNPEDLAKVADYLKRLEVAPAPQKFAEGLNPTTPATLYQLSLGFSTGTIYHIFGFEAGLNISASDMGPLAISYKTDKAAIDGLRALMNSIAQRQDAAVVPAEVSAALPDPEDILRVNLYNNADKTYVPIGHGLGGGWQELSTMLRGMKPLSGPLGRPISDLNMLEVTRDSDRAKFVYRLYENGLTVEGTAVEGVTVAEAYALESPALWKLFLGTAKRAFDSYPSPGAYWLGLMSEPKIKQITYCDNADGPRGFITVFDTDWQPIAELLRGIEVEAPAVSLDRSVPPAADSVSVIVEFNNGIQYGISVESDTLSIVSSDISYGLRYGLPSDCAIGDLRTLVNPPIEEPLTTDANPMTGKPVIYLYPEKTTDVNVSLDFDGAVTYTYPAYRDGWHVTAQPDGTLTDKADGSTHYYLFWEGIAHDEWEHERGFVVKGSETEAFLREKLAFLGLTPREYNDFITYWAPKMKGNPYNLISFSGAQYGEIAKLTVSPTPDSILRVHMVWQPLDAPVAIEPQVLSPFERTGFAVVEWGGTEVVR